MRFRMEVESDIIKIARGFVHGTMPEADLHRVVAELDAILGEQAQAKRLSNLWSGILRLLRAAHPIVPVEAKTKNCTGEVWPTTAGWNTHRCSRSGGWTFDGLTAPMCKQHIEKRLENDLQAIRRNAAKQVTGRDAYGVGANDIDEMRAVYTALGLTMEEADR